VSIAGFVPPVLAAIFWFGLWRLNRTRGWFTVGELIFWDVVALIVIQLIWLRWF